MKVAGFAYDESDRQQLTHVVQVLDYLRDLRKAISKHADRRKSNRTSRPAPSLASLARPLPALPEARMAGSRKASARPTYFY